jgi:hypothetical protein
MDAKQAQHTAKTMALCAKAQRTQDDIWCVACKLRVLPCNMHRLKDKHHGFSS